MKKNKIPTTARELERKIKAYFKKCEKETVDKNGEVILDSNGRALKSVAVPYTLTGLALALGLDSREALFEFSDPEMARLVKMAVMKIEDYAEQKLFSKEAFSGVKLFLSVNFERWQSRDDIIDDNFKLPEEVKKWTV